MWYQRSGGGYRGESGKDILGRRKCGEDQAEYCQGRENKGGPGERSGLGAARLRVAGLAFHPAWVLCARHCSCDQTLETLSLIWIDQQALGVILRLPFIPSFQLGLIHYGYDVFNLLWNFRRTINGWAANNNRPSPIQKYHPGLFFSIPLATANPKDDTVTNSVARAQSN